MISRRRWIVALVLLVAGALAVRALIGSGDELVGAIDLLGRPQLGWLAVAIAAEVVSYVSYAGGQRILIALAVPRPPGLAWLLGLATAAQAVANVLPAGYALSGVLSFRMLMRRGLSPALIVWVLFLSSALYMGVLALIGLGGAQLAGDRGAAGDVRLGAGVLLGVIVVALLAAVALRRAGVGRQVRDWLLLRVESLSGMRGRRPALDAGKMRSRLGEAPRARPRELLTAGGLFAGSWLLDAACLAASFAAVGASPPWRGLLLAYCAGQIAAVLPITPGGLGLVEGSITLALVAYGGAATSTLAAVLLYRLLSYWALLPVGGVGYLALRRSTPAPTEATPVPTPT